MLSLLSTQPDEECETFISSERRNRNQQTDLALAIHSLYEFKRSLEKLHPSVLPIIEAILRSDV